MGCDGGTIPKRAEQVQEPSKPLTADDSKFLSAKWKVCSLSGRPLRQPIVCDKYGRMYNKEVIMEYLLDKHSYGNIIIPHIKKLRDVVTLKLKENPDKSGADFCCPITMKEMSGKAPFLFIWGCGCVFSEAAHKEMKNEDNCCIVCAKPYESTNICIINGEVDNNITLIIKKKRKRDVKDNSILDNVSKEIKESTPKVLMITDNVKSIYNKGDDSEQRNWLTKGTFSRYAA
jgi:hypothetical protein